MRHFTFVLGFVALGSLAAACSTSTPESVGNTEQAQISDIHTMTQRADGNFDVICKNGNREVVTAAQIAANQVCGGGGTGAGRTIIYGTTDSCDPGRAVASITSSTDCMTLSDSDRAWSVSVNGQCTDISDTTVRKACLANQPGRTLIYGTSDSCDDSKIVASIGPTTDCNTLSDSDRAWSVKIDGRCSDISDTTIRKACMASQPGRILIYGTSDSCDDSKIVASVGPTTDCNTLSDSDRSWSVKVDGQCKDISDTTVRKACIGNQPDRVLIYGTSDSCDDSKLLTSVGPTTDCSTLSDSDRSWSVKVRGQCLDISDTTVRKACMVHQQ